MAEIKFSQLPDATGILGTETLAMVQSGVSVQADFDEIFSDTNFKFAGGFLDTIQDINTTAFPEFTALQLDTFLVIDRDTLGTPPFIKGVYNQVPTSLPWATTTFESSGFDDVSSTRLVSQFAAIITDDTAANFSGGFSINITESSIHEVCYEWFDGANERIKQERRLENLAGYQSFSEHIFGSASQDIDETIIGKTVITNSGFPVVFTIPLGETLPLHTELDIIRGSTGSAVIQADVGVLLNEVSGGSHTLENQWDRVTLRKIVNDQWTIASYASSESTPTDQETYDASPNGEINLTAAKPRVYNATDVGIRAPSMTQAQFNSIPSVLNGENAWANDVDRPIYQIGPDGAPSTAVGAYLSDIAALQEDTVIGGCYLTAEAETTITTAGTFEQISGVFAATKLIEFSVDAAGTLTYTGPETREMVVTASISGSFDVQSDDVLVAAFKNDVEILGTRTQVSLDGLSPSFNAAVPIGPVQMSQSDNIKIKWTNVNSPAKNITAKTVSFLTHTVGGTETGVGVQNSHGGFYGTNALTPIVITGVNNAVKIIGNQASYNLVNFTYSSDRLTYIGPDNKFFKVTLDVSAYISAGGPMASNFFIYKNGLVAAGPPQSEELHASINSRNNCAVSKIVQLSAGDYLEGFVTSSDVIEDIIVINRSLIATQI